ncbi:MAG TPA: hydrogenase maturation protease [Thermoanaerobaculia bacterium]|nr:hydrogenase maturation protease [Thermoanaerobaculia bacterium]HUM28656.1 hydrogenase maturation protease [Thermoanaerobaculia bacterium]HXK66736.1 hydrogenase maturation protease [Thermoanaerobaculia bacterium]
MAEILILGLGNPLFRDDGIGVRAIDILERHFSSVADLESSAEHGMALMDHFIGYRYAILIDAIQTGQHPPGTVRELDPSRLGRVLSPSPHYAGLPEMIEAARQLDVSFPDSFVIISVEVEDMATMIEGLTPDVEAALPRIVDIVDEKVRNWLHNSDGQPSRA